jgi:hypothetical protein
MRVPADAVFEPVRHCPPISRHQRLTSILARRDWWHVAGVPDYHGLHDVVGFAVFS